MTSHPFSVAGQRVVVVGAARSGVAAAHLLVRRGASVVLTDTRETIDPADELRRAGVVLELGGHRGETLTGADLIVLSPGVSPKQADVAAARAAGVPVIGELELAARAAATSACFGDTPGLSTIRSAPVRVSPRCPPSSRTTPPRTCW